MFYFGTCSIHVWEKCSVLSIVTNNVYCLNPSSKVSWSYIREEVKDSPVSLISISISITVVSFLTFYLFGARKRSYLYIRLETYTHEKKRNRGFLWNFTSKTTIRLFPKKSCRPTTLHPVFKIRPTLTRWTLTLQKLILKGCLDPNTNFTTSRPVSAQSDVTRLPSPPLARETPSTLRPKHTFTPSQVERPPRGQGRSTEGCDWDSGYPPFVTQ